MPQTLQVTSRWRILLGALALGLAYAAASELVALVTSFGNTVGATFWPGAGLTLAALLLTPRRAWPFLILAVAVTEGTMDVVEGFRLQLAASWAVANAAEPLCAALLIGRLRRGSSLLDLRKPKDLWLFGLCAVIVGPFVGALIGTAAGVAFAGDAWWPRLPRWWVGDGIGVLVIAPALVALVGLRSIRFPAAAWSLMPATVTAVVALGPWSFTQRTGLLFLVLPVLALGAARSGTRVTAIGILIVAVIAEAVTATGGGPFGSPGPFNGLVIAQMFLAMSAFTALIIAALINDLISRDELEKLLRKQALHDGLTGLANRSLLLDRLKLASERLRRHPGKITLAYIDLDGFKHVNDHYGHAVGDSLLTEAARRLTSVVRPEDTVARLGGDEFLVLLDSAGSLEHASRVASRIAADLSQPYILGQHAVLVTASIGLTTTGTAIDDADAFISAADDAMYEAKRAGRRHPSRDPAPVT